MGETRPYFEYVDGAYDLNKRTWPEMTEEAALADAIAFADRIYGMPIGDDTDAE
jgi:hypothetical protein